MSYVPVRGEWRDLYEQAFTKDVHQLLVWGYEVAKSAIIGTANTGSREEESITGFIRAAIDGRLNSCDPAGRFGHYYVRETSPELDDIRTGKRRKEVDLEIVCGGRSPRCRFVFECKRLCANTHPISGYTGDEGMQCFLRGEYAADCSLAGMLGYIQSHAPDYWFTELNRSFRSRSALLRTASTPSPISILPALQHEWVSVHHRTNGTLIRIFHIFLECC